jgi:hypothetical protein
MRPLALKLTTVDLALAPDHGLPTLKAPTSRLLAHHVGGLLPGVPCWGFAPYKTTPPASGAFRQPTARTLPTLTWQAHRRRVEADTSHYPRSPAVRRP